VSVSVETVEMKRVAAAGTDGDDFALHRLFFRRVRDDNAARGLFFGF
jgi:hypothetical protein